MNIAMLLMKTRRGSRSMAKVGCHAIFGTGLTMHLTWSKQGTNANPSDSEDDEPSSAGGDSSPAVGGDTAPQVQGGGGPQQTPSQGGGGTAAINTSGRTPSTSRSGKRGQRSTKKKAAGNIPESKKGNKNKKWTGILISKMLISIKV